MGYKWKMVWLIALRTIGWVYTAMCRPLMRTTAWVYAIFWTMFGPLNIFNAFIVNPSPMDTEWLIHTTLHVLQFALGLFLMRYLWRSSWPSRQETVRLGKIDAQRPAP
jgi:hypothetical protein